VNGKMGLISMYLRQMEDFMARNGYIGLVWETRALDQIIFRPGNAFTLPAGLTILFLFMQTMCVVFLSMAPFLSSRAGRAALSVGIGVSLIILISKTITVDYRQELPQLFEQNAPRDHMGK